MPKLIAIFLEDLVTNKGLTANIFRVDLFLED